MTEPSPPADGSPRVYLDVMLGKLATILRMAGWDAAYALDQDVEADDAILDAVDGTDRILVTRDRQLADRAPESVLLVEKDVEQQVCELRDAGFTVEFGEPTQCSNCNGGLESVPAGVTTPDHAPAPSETDVWQCEDCGQYFWKGSHWDDVVSRLGTEPDAREHA